MDMAAVRLIALHANKGKSVAQCLGDRTDYAKNPEKTEKGNLVTAYECDPMTVDEEFMLSKRKYQQITGREQQSDVIAYQIRQSFKPGEITAEEANRLGYELAMRFTKGKYAFIVATHTDRAHKVNGDPPGQELKSYSYSIKEFGELLDVDDSVAYDIVKRCRIETFTAGSWKRIRKDVFEAWYNSQSRYRTPEDRERDAEREEATITMPEMARLLMISRKEVYSILASPKNEGVFEYEVIADRKEAPTWLRSYQEITNSALSICMTLKMARESRNGKPTRPWPRPSAVRLRSSIRQRSEPLRFLPARR